MKRALVIGASGGIGRALVPALQAKGAEVVGLSRKGDGLDVHDAESVDRVLGGVDGTFDTVMIVTGILAPEGAAPEKSLDAIDADAMRRVMEVNAIGPALLMRHLPRLLPKEGRSVTGVLTARVGSIGDNRMGGWYSYRMSKAAANMAVHGAAIEIGRSHADSIIVALHPGTVETAFTADYSGHKKVSAEEAAGNLVGVLTSLTREQTGGFYDYAGEEIPW